MVRKNIQISIPIPSELTKDEVVKQLSAQIRTLTGKLEKTEALAKKLSEANRAYACKEKSWLSSPHERQAWKVAAYDKLVLELSQFLSGFVGALPKGEFQQVKDILSTDGILICTNDDHGYNDEP